MVVVRGRRVRKKINIMKSNSPFTIFTAAAIWYGCNWPNDALRCPAIMVMLCEILAADELEFIC